MNIKTYNKTTYARNYKIDFTKKIDFNKIDKMISNILKNYKKFKGLKNEM